MLTVIIALAVLLVILLMDWQAVGKRVPLIGRLVTAWQSRGQRPRMTIGANRLPVQPQLQDRKPPRLGDVWHHNSQNDSAEPIVPIDFIPPQTPAQPATLPSSNPEVLELLEQADVCFRKGELDAAEQHYLKAAAKDPRCSKAYSRLGVIYLETGEDWQDAEEAFRQALKYESDNGYVLNNLGLVLYHQDRYADAIRQFELAVRQDEHNATRHSNLGKAYMAMRQYAKAESSFKKALKLAPNEMEHKDLLEEAIEKKQAHRAMIPK